MKKVILAGASLMVMASAAPAFAQATAPALCPSSTGNCSVIDSNGNSNTADVDQSASTNSKSGIVQSGDNLTAIVTQAAGDNISEVDQQATAAGSGNFTATVTQSGGAGSIVSQSALGVDSDGLTAVVNQAGDSESDIAQTGDNESTENIFATVDQLGDGHSSIITQSERAGGTNDGDLSATVIQTGSGNSSDITQLNRQQTAIVDQSGTGNTSILGQTARRQNEAFITQSGDGGNSDVTQTGRSGLVSLDQSGTGNDLLVFQADNNLDGQTVDVVQTGDDNFADVFQDGGTDGDNLAVITQDGDGGTAVVTQVEQANADEAYITQGIDAVDNFALIEQTGDGVGGTPSLNIAEIEQDGGADNTSLVLQGDTTGFAGTVAGASESDATSLQDGEALGSLIVQGGALQIAFVDQIGSENDSSVFQGNIGGSENQAGVEQTDALNTSVIYQDSSLNFALAIQGGGDGNTSSIEQGFAGGAGIGADENIASVQQDGSDNISNIFQNSFDVGGLNTALVGQENTGNESFIEQEGDNNFAGVIQTDGSFSEIFQDGSGNSVTVTQGTP